MARRTRPRTVRSRGGAGQRAHTIAAARRHRARADENSQEIFETLNARRTPLTAADLIKNFVFQRLEAEGADTAKAYAELWPFESAFWEKEISVGRNLVTRGSLFLNQWLVSRTGQEISPKATFTRFKYYAEHEDPRTMAQLLAVLKEQAGLYEGWTTRAADRMPTSPGSSSASTGPSRLASRLSSPCCSG